VLQRLPTLLQGQCHLTAPRHLRGHRSSCSTIQPHPCGFGGPLPVLKEGFNYVFTMIDCFTCWMEAVMLKNIEASNCAEALIAGWVSRYGVPASITSDPGHQFSSAVWDALCSRLGIQHITTLAYHPQANGMIERAHRQLKDALCSRLAGAKWPQHLS
jgi:transposase InsO family protein